MKVFVAGATGALGKQLVPMLVAKGHDVVGMTRTEAKRDQLCNLGARPVVADALDVDAVGHAVGEAEPDVIVHQLTAIPPAVDMRHFDRDFALTNRLRIEGTDNLLSAAQAVGTKRFVAQSNAGVPHARTGGPIKREDAPLDDDSPPSRADLPASTTSSTTSRHRCPSSSRCWRPPSVRSDRCGCRAGWGASRQVTWP